MPVRRVALAIASAMPLLGSLVHAEERLVFPRIVFQQGRFSGVAIANSGSSTAHVSVQAYASDGSAFLAPVKLELGPGAQTSRLAAQLLAAPASVAQGSSATRVWLEVTSDADGLTGFYLEGNDALDFMDGSALGGSGTDLVLLLVENRGDRVTEISLVNPDAEDAARVDVDFLRADGSLVAARSQTLPARGALAGPIAEIFDVDFASVDALRVRSDLAVVCQGVVYRQSDNSLVTVPAQNVALPSKTLTFPQLAEGAGWSTSIGLANFTAAQTLVTITAYKPDGTLFSAPTVAENPVSRTLGAASILRSDLRSLFGFAGASLEIGWVKAEAPAEALGGYIEYGAGTNRALVPALTAGNTRALFSHQALAAPYFTGLAVLNPGSLAANVEVVSLDAASRVLGKTRRVLRPGERASQLVQEWVPAAAGTVSGSVFVKSDLPTVATELFGTDSLAALANVPPQAARTTFDPGAALPSITVSPPVGVVEVGRSLKFNVSGASGARWSVNGVAGGDAASGRVSTAGLYTAPAAVPADPTVVVQAASATGEQAGGATLDVVGRETLASGLTQVTAVAYLQAAQRFFVAEQQALAAAPGGRVAAVSDAVISEQLAAGGRARFASISGETIAKLLPFVDTAGASYLLVAGYETGRIYRLSIATRDLVTVASGLDHPVSLALDPISGALLVGEASQVSAIARVKFDPTAGSLAAAGGDAPETPTGVPVAQARGLAINGCDGSVYVTSADGTIREFQGGRERTVVAGLDGPKQIMVLHRRGSGCSEGLALVVAEATRIGLHFPRARISQTLLDGTDNALDLAFFPRGRPFVPGGEGSIVVAEARAGAAASRVTRIRVGPLYDDVAPQPVAAAAAAVLPYRDPRDDTFETAASTNLRPADIVAVHAARVDDSVVLGIAFDRALPVLRAGARPAITGFIDLDYQPGGEPSHAEGYNLFNPKSGFATDAAIDLAKGLLQVGTQAATPIRIVANDNVLSVRLPPFLSRLPDIRIAIVVGNAAEITDVAPNYGAIRVPRP